MSELTVASESGEARQLDAASASSRSSLSGVIGGGAALWAGTIAVNVSTAVVLTVLARSGASGRFASASSVFALVFVAAVIPSALQLGAAAAAADGRGTPPFPGRLAARLTFGTAATVPVLSPLLHLPYLAVAAVAALCVPLTGLAVRRGALVGRQRFIDVGRSFGTEAGARILFGIALGAKWGPTGVALGLLLAAVAAWVLAPDVPAQGATVRRPVTGLAHTAAAVGLLAVVVNLDVIIAPGALGAASADRYDTAAVPAKAVFLALLAAGMIAFPFVRQTAARRTFVVPVLATLSAGVVLAIMLVAGRPVVAAVLGRDEPQAVLTSLVALAMALAASTSLVVNLSIARGARRPWVPLAAALPVVVGAALSHPSPVTFATAVLVSQLVAFAGSVVLAFVAPDPLRHGVGLVSPAAQLARVRPAVALVPGNGVR